MHNAWRRYENPPLPLEPVHTFSSGMALSRREIKHPVRLIEEIFPSDDTAAESEVSNSAVRAKSKAFYFVLFIAFHPLADFIVEFHRYRFYDLFIYNNTGVLL